MVFVEKQFLLLIPFIDDDIFPEKNGIPICDVHPEIFAGIFFKRSSILLNFVINFVFDVKTALEHHIGDSRATRIANCILPHSKRGGGGRLGNFPLL